MKSTDLLNEYDTNYYLHRVEGWKDFANGKLNKKRIELLSKIDFKDKKVLDVGFARGDVLQYCHKKGSKCYGIDYSIFAYDIAKKCCDPAISLKVMDIENIDKLNEKDFDIVLLLDILEHVSDEEIFTFIDKLKSIIAKKCNILISTPIDIKLGDYKGMHFNQWYFEKILLAFKDFTLVNYKIDKDYYVNFCY